MADGIWHMADGRWQIARRLVSSFILHFLPIGHADFVKYKNKFDLYPLNMLFMHLQALDDFI
jgi:hypothetical protein